MIRKRKKKKQRMQKKLNYYNLNNKIRKMEMEKEKMGVLGAAQGTINNKKNYYNNKKMKDFSVASI